jgi:hypothetical protein
LISKGAINNLRAQQKAEQRRQRCKKREGRKSRQAY